MADHTPTRGEVAFVLAQSIVVALAHHDSTFADIFDGVADRLVAADGEPVVRAVVEEAAAIMRHAAASGRQLRE